MIHTIQTNEKSLELRLILDAESCEHALEIAIKIHRLSIDQIEVIYEGYPPGHTEESCHTHSAKQPTSESPPPPTNK